MKTISYTEALREALAEEMRRDTSVILMGEDIGRYGGAFGVTRTLLDRFGPRRVINTPISELSFVGAAVGAAMLGMRPVVEIMFMDFITLAMDPIVNMAAKLRYVFGRQARCPLVVRAVAGGGRCYGPTHSQSLEAWFVHVPGLKVVAPSSPADAGSLLISAIRDDNPVLFIEHKMLYNIKGIVPSIRQARPEPIGRARRIVRGRDLTIVAWSWMTRQAADAAAIMRQEGISAEVIDLRSLAPIDVETIVESVKRTGRLLVAQEACRTCGVGAEVAARVFEAAHDYLNAPILRVATPDVPLSASPILENAAIPDAHRIASAARELVKMP